jgi:hypothetical protein
MDVLGEACWFEPTLDDTEQINSPILVVPVDDGLLQLGNGIYAVRLAERSGYGNPTTCLLPVEFPIQASVS